MTCTFNIASTILRYFTNTRTIKNEPTWGSTLLRNTWNYSTVFDKFDTGRPRSLLSQFKSNFKQYHCSIPYTSGQIINEHPVHTYIIQIRYFQFSSALSFSLSLPLPKTVEIRPAEYHTEKTKYAANWSAFPLKSPLAGRYQRENARWGARALEWVNWISIGRWPRVNSTLTRITLAAAYAAASSRNKTHKRRWWSCPPHPSLDIRKDGRLWTIQRIDCDRGIGGDMRVLLSPWYDTRVKGLTRNSTFLIGF